MRSHRDTGGLAPSVRVDVQYTDTSPAGGAVSPKLQATIRRLCRPIYRALDRRGPEFVVSHSEDLLRRCFAGPEFKKLCGMSYPRLPAAVLFPAQRSFAPRGMLLTSADTGDSMEIPVERNAWKAWGDWLATAAVSPAVRRCIG